MPSAGIFPARSPDCARTRSDRTSSFIFTGSGQASTFVGRETRPTHRQPGAMDSVRASISPRENLPERSAVILNDHFSVTPGRSMTCQRHGPSASVSSGRSSSRVHSCGVCEVAMISTVNADPLETTGGATET